MRIPTDSMPEPPTPQIGRIALAFAQAENSPPEWNNPIDLTYSFGFPNEGPQNPAGVLRFCLLDNGWRAAFQQISMMLDGSSHVYKPTDPISLVAQKFTGGDNAEAWAQNVATFLGKTPETAIQDC